MPETDHAARRRAAFLRALGAGGNVSMAAREARLGKGTVYAWRRSDPEFALAWAAALERAGVMLGEGAADISGAMTVWSGAGGWARVTRIADGARKWTAGAERAFLSHLAATANVRAACVAAGFSSTAVYRRRMRWPGFRAAWNEAIEQGYARVELMLIQRATATLDPVGAAIDGIDIEIGAAGAMSTAEALNLLKLHRAAVKGGPAQRYDARAKPVDIEAVRADIIRRVEAIRRARATGSG